MGASTITIAQHTFLAHSAPGAKFDVPALDRVESLIATVLLLLVDAGFNKAAE